MQNYVSPRTSFGDNITYQCREATCPGVVLEMPGSILDSCEKDMHFFQQKSRGTGNILTKEMPKIGISRRVGERERNHQQVEAFFVQEHLRYVTVLDRHYEVFVSIIILQPLKYQQSELHENTEQVLERHKSHFQCVDSSNCRDIIKRESIILPVPSVSSDLLKHKLVLNTEWNFWLYVAAVVLNADEALLNATSGNAEFLIAA
ncbi:hypothetical protein Anapl_18306 [Anas platyrhynchos]|uniref:Uncharacterized protein n=1 Tax=Anas platyrhynchos TaxID=8839 RepID=R0LPH9_ANAPL|nr:hypothetical protein Anapl_18306 [Anas platyrhynchos]